MHTYICMLRAVEILNCIIPASFALQTTLPLAYSEDLRWRVVWLYLYKEIAAADIAHFLYISERSVYRYVERFRTTGPACILSEHEEFIIVNSVLSSPGIYLRELQQQLSQSTGRWVHESTICRCLRRLGMT